MHIQTKSTHLIASNSALAFCRVTLAKNLRINIVQRVFADLTVRFPHTGCDDKDGAAICRMPLLVIWQTDQVGRRRRRRRGIVIDVRARSVREPFLVSGWSMIVDVRHISNMKSVFHTYRHFVRWRGDLIKFDCDTELSKSRNYQPSPAKIHYVRNAIDSIIHETENCAHRHKYCAISPITS